MKSAETGETGSHAPDGVPGLQGVAKLQNSVMWLDKEWSHYRETHLYRGNEPSAGAGAGLLAVLAGACLCFVKSGVLMPFGVLVAVVGIFFLVYWMGRAREFKARHLTYEVDRAKLLSEISRQTHRLHPSHPGPHTVESLRPTTPASAHHSPP